ncbi:hypothetical protein [Primorskyibacter sp. S187A]|uniref:hypothetical protein n=1 Tax=Primorskyibacter sp. S187A TaxID=3415130 RepID=UPI003C7E00EB
MTALKDYERLEATGLWRASAEAQRREVVVSLGDATLMLKDMSDQALTHWSLAAVERLNPGHMPAIYHPDGDPDELLELGPDAKDMVDAIEKLRRAISRARPRQGRLRWLLSASILGGAAALAFFWLPGALRDHTLRVVPEVKRDAIGLALLDEITTLSGPPCRAGASAPALRMLARRVLGESRAGDLIVLRGGPARAAHLPGGFILLNRDLIELSPEPEAAAGFALAEDLRARAVDPLGRLLDHAGFWASARLLTTGQVPQDALEAFAAHVMTAPQMPLPTQSLVDGFQSAQLHLRPYAFALDVTGESVLPLIEADQLSGQSVPEVLRDNDWLRLQAICE